MCLTTVEEVYERPSSLVVDGWKQFSGSDAKPKFSSFRQNGANDVPLDQWIKADHSQTSTKSGVMAGDKSFYTPGFHAYYDETQLHTRTTKRSAAPDGFRRVYLRNVSCLGLEAGKKVVIAQEMFVPSDPNGWPPRAESEEKKKLMEQLADIQSKIKNFETGNA